MAEPVDRGDHFARIDDGQLYVYPCCDKCDGPALEIAVSAEAFGLWLSAGKPTQTGDLGLYFSWLGAGKGKRGRKNPNVKGLHKIAGTNTSPVLCPDCWTDSRMLDLTTPEARAAGAALLAEIEAATP